MTKNHFVKCELVILLLITANLMGCASSAFKNAKKQHTISAYEQFLAEYGESDFVPQVRALRERLWFEQAKRKNSIWSYDSYLNEFPNGKFVQQSRELRAAKVHQEERERIYQFPYDLTKIRQSDLKRIKTIDGKMLQDFHISVNRQSDTELIALILLSEPMGDEERRYWFSVLSIMTPAQVEELREILRYERALLFAVL